MSILLYIACLVIILWIIKKLKFFKDNYLTLKHIYTLFLIKVAVSFVVYGIYTFYYNDRTNSDIFKYYDDGRILYQSLFNNPLDYLRMLTGIDDEKPHIQKYYQKMNFWIKPYTYEIVNENKTLIRLNAIISIFSFSNYFIHVLIFVFFSFIGLFAIFKVISVYINKNHIYIAYAIILFPSTLFWSSAILKEAILFLNLGMTVYFTDKLKNNFSLHNSLYIIIFLILLMFSKMYIFILILPALSFVLISSIFQKINKVLIFILTHFLYILIFFYSEIFLPFDFSNIVVTKQHHFIQMAEEYNAGSKIEIAKLENSLISFLQNTPQAVVNALFRPFLWEAHNILSFISATENVFLFLAIIFCFMFFKPNYNNIWLWFSISFCLHLLILIGLTTPVLGAMVRYKIPCLPFLLYILFSIIDINKTKTKLLIVWKKLY